MLFGPVAAFTMSPSLLLATMIDVVLFTIRMLGPLDGRRSRSIVALHRSWMTSELARTKGALSRSSRNRARQGCAGRCEVSSACALHPQEIHRILCKLRLRYEQAAYRSRSSSRAARLGGSKARREVCSETIGHHRTIQVHSKITAKPQPEHRREPRHHCPTCPIRRRRHTPACTRSREPV